MQRIYDVYVGNLLVAGAQRSLIYCFNTSQAMVLRADDVIAAYTGTCPGGVVGFVPYIHGHRPSPRPGAIPEPTVPAGVPTPSASLAPARLWRVRIYRPAAPPTP
ncbi:MAG: hypothetical protein ACLPYS_17605 [Vulcanimicrobiaceae bacterium]